MFFESLKTYAFVLAAKMLKYMVIAILAKRRFPLRKRLPGGALYNCSTNAINLMEWDPLWGDIAFWI